MTSWTDELFETIRILWIEKGWSATAIAEHLGGKPTRNAILGKLARAGLLGTRDPKFNSVNLTRPKMASNTGRQAPWALPATIRRDGSNGRGTTEAIKHRAPTVAMPVFAVPVGEPESLRLSIMALNFDSCRWPSDGDGVVTYCGHRKTPKTSFCPYHADKAYTPVPRRY